MRRLAIAIAVVAALAVPAGAGGWVGDRHARAAARGPGGGGDLDGAAHGAPARRHADRRRRAVDHDSWRERLADVPCEAGRGDRQVRRARRVSHGGQVGLRGERRAGCDRLRHTRRRTRTRPSTIAPGTGGGGSGVPVVAVRPGRDRPRRSRRHRARPAARPPSGDPELIAMNRLLIALALALLAPSLLARLRVGCAGKGPERQDLVLERPRRPIARRSTS